MGKTIYGDLCHDVRPLKSAGWEYSQYQNNSDGWWTDPKTGQQYRTLEALSIQEKRDV